MKNIHILPTTQPSRLWINNLLQGKLELSKETLIGSNTAQHMYITSDEEIKEGDYCVDGNDIYGPYEDGDIATDKFIKIILTTDSQLIRYGVQSINDEFLQWFVKNPTCEFVEVQKWTNYSEVKYKITIPQEEPKQDWYCPKCQSYVSSESVTFEETHQTCNTSVIIEESKQETLEEAAEKYSQGWGENDDVKSFIAGGKHMAERMYSEDEVKELIEKALTHNNHNLCGPLVTAQNEIRTANFGVWFEQNKKKS